MAYYRLKRRSVTPAGYADFMRRATWKAYQAARRREKVGNYLGIL